jgi:hypothetical protein
VPGNSDKGTERFETLLPGRMHPTESSMPERWTDIEPGWPARLKEKLADMGTTKAKLKLAQGYWDHERSVFVEAWIKKSELDD